MKYSDLTYEQYLLEELPKNRMKEIRAHLEENPEAAAHLDSLRKSNEEILSTYPADIFAEKIRRHQLFTRTGTGENKTSPKDRYSIMRRAAAPAAAAVMLLITGYLVIPNIPGSGPITGPENGIRLKGSGGLSVYRKGKTEVERLKNLDRVMKGDLIQIAITPTKGRFAAVISIDGRSMVTVHYPLQGDRAASVKPGKRIVLKKSYELDDAPEYERFFLITSDGEFNVREIREKASDLAADTERAKINKLPLPKNFTQDAVILLKR